MKTKVLQNCRVKLNKSNSYMNIVCDSTYMVLNMTGPEFGRRHFDISKELEIINFRLLQENQLDDGPNDESTKHWIEDDTKPDDDGKNKGENQFKSFQKAMRFMLIWGQCIGLNPVTGILQKDLLKMRFKVYSLKFLFALTMAIAQTIGTLLCFYRLFRNPSSITALGFVTFFTTACFTTISFIRIAPKWPILMKELINSRLDEYIHPNIVKKCKIACGAFMGMAVMEHVMSILSRIARLIDCSADVANIGEVYVKAISPWLYEFNVPYIPALGVFIQYLNLVATATWNYADMFIVCMSLYLTSILDQINKRIASTASKNYVPATTWGMLRADYTRATNLVKLFDDVFSGIVLVTFANDLFFICLQLYNVFAFRYGLYRVFTAIQTLACYGTYDRLLYHPCCRNGIHSAQINNKLCPGHENSVFRTYMYPAYLMYSTVYLCGRFLTVALVAGGVNTSSLLPLPVLYAVPSTSYSKEVERFQNQVNGDVVALSGLHFFYITRDLVLTVAATIVTYELVLLQFSTDDK